MPLDNRDKTIAVVGAGLVGCLAALSFKKLGYTVRVYESRNDIRTPDEQLKTQLRSINLAVSSRGINALEKIDNEMADRVLKDVIPMYGRMVHDLKGNQHSQQYGLYNESINSIDRAKLNRVMLDELELAGVELFFNYKMVSADVRKPQMVFSNGETVDDIDVVIGSDGSYSKLRTQLQRHVRMDYEQQYIDHLYLELRIPPSLSSEKENDNNSKFLLDPNHLHIWPRHEYMLIALANDDGSFTSTLFAPEWVFEKYCNNDKSIIDFFTTQFPDALNLIGSNSLLESFHNNPRGSLMTVRCNPYHYKDKCILIGDAAHSMVPFYGQGMNCGFEDVKVLTEILENHDNQEFENVFNEYSSSRHEDLKAIVNLAMDNYIEMRHSVTSPWYLLRKKLDGMLAKTLPGDMWLPLYTMVSFRSDISYSKAVKTEKRQRKILNQMGGGLVTAGTLAIASTVLFRYFIKK